MNIIFELGKINDIDELEQLYNDLNDYLAKGVNLSWMVKRCISRSPKCRSWSYKF